MRQINTPLTNKSDQDIIQFHINNWLTDGIKLEDIEESFKFMSQNNTPEIPLDIHTLNLIITYGKTKVNKTVKGLRKVG